MNDGKLTLVRLPQLDGWMDEWMGYIELKDGWISA